MARCNVMWHRLSPESFLSHIFAWDAKPLRNGVESKRRRIGRQTHVFADDNGFVSTLSMFILLDRIQRWVRFCNRPRGVLVFAISCKPGEGAANATSPSKNPAYLLTIMGLFSHF